MSSVTPDAADQISLSLIRLLSDPSADQVLRKDAETQFNALRTSQPSVLLSSLLRTTRQVVAQFPVSNLNSADQSLAQATLILLKNSLPKVFASCEPCLLKEAVELIFTGFLNLETHPEVRRRLGHCVELVLRDDANCKGEVKEALSASITDAVVQSYATSQSDTTKSALLLQQEKKTLLRFLVEGADSGVFFDRVIAGKEALFRQMLDMEAEKENNTAGLQELKGILFLKVFGNYLEYFIMA